MKTSQDHSCISDRHPPHGNDVPIVEDNHSPPHELIHGDALDQNTIPENSVDLIITSPPYNVSKAYTGEATSDAIDNAEYLDFTAKWLAHCYFWSRSTSRLCVNISLDKNKNGKQPLAAQLTHLAMKVGWQYHATIIWNEGNISKRTAWGSWKSASAPHVISPVETIIIFYKDSWKRLRQGKSDINAEEFKQWVLGLWDFNGENGKRIGHEAPFPKELPRRCIKLFSFQGDIILDPFVGSGTTMIEAINHHRVAIGIEKQKRYCELTLRRIEQECCISWKPSSPAKPDGSINSSWNSLRQDTTQHLPKSNRIPMSL